MIQTVEDFVMQIAKNYPNWAKQRDPQYLISDYSLVIREDWDLNELYRIFVTEWDKPSVPPMPAWFRQFADRVKTETAAAIEKPFNDTKMAELRKVADWFNTEDYQYYRKRPPEVIQMLIRKNGFTDEQIDKMCVGAYD